MVKTLLESGADPAITGGEYGTALIAACSRGSEPISQMLLQRRADPHYGSGKHGTALQAASRAGYVPLVILLLKYGVDVNAGEIFQRSALCTGCRVGSGEIAKILLEHGANVNSRGSLNGETAFQNACISSGTLQEPLPLLQLLLAHRASPIVTGGSHGSPLQAAASGESIETVQFLLNLGADLNFIGESEEGTACESSLANAAYWGREELVKFMLEEGAQVNTQDAQD